MSRLTSVLIALALALAAVSTAAAQARHSGTVRDVRGDVLTVEEMGPWTGERQERVSRSITITPDTAIDVVARSEPGAAVGSADWPGGFKATPAGRSEIRPGDFVTVTTQERGGRLVATKISVVRPEGEGAASPPLPPLPPKEDPQK